ncbi:TMEM175 family protein [Actinomadura macrotermitis]|uniref:TMEM175 family protein n=1 Tax=Actinomadura macrotermitis TaxID=2585200 RepID=UPI00188651A5|nr:TMEM175 family protein [Actinomadura macrotermitis]
MADTEVRRAAPGFSVERMAMFTDAVLAIAITLLVIEIPRPEGEVLERPHDLRRFLWGSRDSFLAYVLAFFLLWGVWRRHNLLCDQLAGLNRAMAAWHAPLLLFVAFLPYPTSLIGHTSGDPLALCVFAAAEALMVFSEAGLKEAAYRSGLLAEGVDPVDVRRSAGASWSVGALFAATAVLAWWVPHVWIAWLFTPVLAAPGGRLVERLRR